MKKVVAILFVIIMAMSYRLVKQKRHDAYLRREKIKRDSLATDHFNKCKLVKEKGYISIPIDSNDIVFLGTSITEAFPLTYLSNNIHVKNYAVAGATIDDIIYMAQHIVNSHPKKVFLEVGINDVRYNFVNGTNFEKDFTDSLAKVFYTLRTYSPQTRLYINSILPIAQADYGPDTDTINAEIKRMNHIIAGMAASTGSVYIDTYDIFQVNGALPWALTPEGIHVNGQVYRKWYQYLQPYLD